MSVLYNPRASMTETQRKNADALIAARRRLDGATAHEQIEPAAHSVTSFENMIEVMKVEAQPLPMNMASVEPQVEAPAGPSISDRDWFVVQEEIVPEVRHVNISDIQRVIANRYDVTKGDLMSSRRSAGLVRPRQIAMYLARTITLRSLPEIGRRFGGRDHTTVLHAVKKIAAIVETDPVVADEINRLKSLIQEIC